MPRFSPEARRRAYWIVGFLLFFVALWSVLLSFYSPQELVERIGVHNGYALAFLVALFGGVSSFTAFSYYATITTLVVGGLNPLVIAPLAGLGIFLSDTFFYYLGWKGRAVISPAWNERRERFSAWLRSKPRWVPPVVTYLYTGLTPLPNDILMVALAFADVRYRRIVVPLLAGSVTLTLIIGLLAGTGASLLRIW